MTNNFGGLLRSVSLPFTGSTVSAYLLNFPDTCNLEFIVIKTESLTMVIHDILLCSLDRGQ